ncbi:MAG: pantoate--beta-alanine ligase [Bacteroidota bacterium]
MEVFTKVYPLQKYLSNINKSKSIGFVPTMGALHKGHLSLIERAQSENDVTVVSIFVNPTQFDKKEDLSTYPRTQQKDIDLLNSIDCNVVFIPLTEDIYLNKVESQNFDFGGLEKVMEGSFRNGHFDGVGTVVKRLFEIVRPTNAYFGEKDFQQLQIIKKMVEVENLPVNIIGCDIYREDDGLAMSSRNGRLNEEQRKEAPLIYQTLLKAQELFPNNSIRDVKEMVKNTFENNTYLNLEYFEIADIKSLTPTDLKNKNIKYRGFIAVFADTVRLIDNIALN